MKIDVFMIHYNQQWVCGSVVKLEPILASMCVM